MRKVVIILTCILLISAVFSACATKKQEPEIDDIKAICELATLECYYNNVAKFSKEKDNIFQKDREMWIEYEGVATIGIDMSKVTMKISGENVEIYLPETELFSIKPVNETLNDSSYTISDDGLFKNKITSEDQQEAVKEAQKEMEKSVRKNNALFKKAENRAKELIENYINKLSHISDTDYKIKWKSAKQNKSRIDNNFYPAFHLVNHSYS